MTRNISRRSLVAGAAWAAPAVLTSTAIPAYASSVNPAKTSMTSKHARQLPQVVQIIKRATKK